MNRPVEIRALDGYKIWIRYSDGIEGEVDLSALLGRGVFRAWEDKALFMKVKIGQAGAITWGDDIELCPDALYLLLTGKEPDDLFSNLRLAKADA
ncbi:DUF2442 domain-containing protein [Acidobacteriota bacterium]